MVKLQAKKRHPIGKSDITRLFAQLGEQIGDAAHLFIGQRVEIVETNSDLVIFLIDKKPLLMKYHSVTFPTLYGALEHPFGSRRLTVDTGAVKFVVNGADVMRPGVVSVTDDVIRDGPVQITEERHGKPIATGIALYDAAEIRARTAGKICRNIHHVGDEIWNLEI
ncbi:MAG: RNA-binding protein [Methanoregulaceae archaeon]|jgi:PUA domain protein|nr:RNA-binding protein [Methanoregulaceae archaeon]